jgi:hypothetical protein
MIHETPEQDIGDAEGYESHAGYDGKRYQVINQASQGPPPRR